MSRLVKDFIEISDHASLDALIERLVEVRDSLPASAEPELKLNGCDVFGRKISISYMRAQTEDEAECDARYARAYQESRQRELSRLEAELGVECRVPRRAGRLRIVA